MTKRKPKPTVLVPMRMSADGQPIQTGNYDMKAIECLLTKSDLEQIDNLFQWFNKAVQTTEGEGIGQKIWAKVRMMAAVMEE